jgi:hypothetical protein
MAGIADVELPPLLAAKTGSGEADALIAQLRQGPRRRPELRQKFNRAGLS